MPGGGVRKDGGKSKSKSAKKPSKKAGGSRADDYRDFESRSDERYRAMAEESRIRQEIHDEMSGEADIRREVNNNLRMASAMGDSYSDEDAYRMERQVRYERSEEGMIDAEVRRRMNAPPC